MKNFPFEVMEQDNKFWNKNLFNLFKSEIVFQTKQSSEHGEEGIIKSIFSAIKPENRWCIDVGAYGIGNSNTYGLIKEGWKSIQFEINARQVAEHRAVLYDLKDVFVEFKYITSGRLGHLIEPDCLDATLLSHSVPYNFDYLSIDVDSVEYEIWRNLKLFHPNVICIEFNSFEHDFSVIGYDPSFSIHEIYGNKGEYGGATIGLLNRLAQDKGYTYVCLDVSNVFFIKNSFAKI